MLAFFPYSIIAALVFILPSTIALLLFQIDSNRKNNHKQYRFTLTPFSIISFLLLLGFLYDWYQTQHSPSSSLGFGLGAITVGIVSILLSIHQVLVNETRASYGKVWLSEAGFISAIALGIYFYNYIPPTPSEYRNDIKIEDEKFEHIRSSILESMKEEHNQSDVYSYFSRSRERELRIQFLDFYFDSSQTKVLFTAIDTVEINFENVNLNEQSSDGNLYYPFVLKGILNSDSTWVISKIDEYHTVVSFNVKSLEKSLKKFSHREMAHLDKKNGELIFQYNIDDIRIFESPLFEE